MLPTPSQVLHALAQGKFEPLAEELRDEMNMPPESYVWFDCGDENLIVTCTIDDEGLGLVVVPKNLGEDRLTWWLHLGVANPVTLTWTRRVITDEGIERLTEDS